MKLALALAVAPLLLAAVIASHALAQDGHPHPVSAAAEAREVPVRRWATDAPLRTGMARIRVAVSALQHQEHGHLDPQQVRILATGIEGQVAYMIANCKLQPQADAALHGIIAELSAGAQALQADPGNRSAIAPMREALQRYPRQFEDPSWLDADEPEE